MYMCASVWHMCYSVHTEVREHRVGSLLLSCVDQTQIIRLGGKCLYPVPSL